FTNSNGSFRLLLATYGVKPASLKTSAAAGELAGRLLVSQLPNETQYCPSPPPSHTRASPGVPPEETLARQFTGSFPYALLLMRSSDGPLPSAAFGQGDAS